MPLLRTCGNDGGGREEAHLLTSITAPTATVGLELPRGLRAPLSSAQPARARDDSSELPITIRSDEPFEALAPLAAGPARHVEEDAAGVTWWFHMPGAGRKNTQVVWDPSRCRLSVGAWSRSVASAAERGSPGRLLWHSATWQPDVNGARATATVSRGWVRVRLPRRLAAVG